MTTRREPSHTTMQLTRGRFVRALVGVGRIAGAILMIELALTRIFSVTMYYHFAFLAISIALFGLSASGVYVYVCAGRFDTRSTATLLAAHSLLFAAVDRAGARGARPHPRRAELHPREPRQDDRDLHARGASVFFGRRRHLARDHPAQEPRQRRLRRRSDWRGRGLPAAAAAAESLRRARRRAARRRAGGRRCAALLAGRDRWREPRCWPRWRSASPAACS